MLSENIYVKSKILKTVLFLFLFSSGNFTSLAHLIWIVFRYSFHDEQSLNRRDLWLQQTVWIVDIYYFNRLFALLATLVRYISSTVGFCLHILLFMISWCIICKQVIHLTSQQTAYSCFYEFYVRILFYTH